MIIFKILSEEGISLYKSIKKPLIYIFTELIICFTRWVTLLKALELLSRRTKVLIDKNQQIFYEITRWQLTLYLSQIHDMKQCSLIVQEYQKAETGLYVFFSKTLSEKWTRRLVFEKTDNQQIDNVL